MKRLLLLSWCMLALALAGRADSFTVSMGDLLSANGKDISRAIAFDNIPAPMKYQGMDILFKKGSTRGPNWNARNDGKYILVYADDGFELSLPDGGTISSVTITCSAEGYTGTLSATPGAISTSGAEITWTGSAQKVTFTNSGSSMRLRSITATYVSQAPVSETPVFTPAPGTYPDQVDVTISAGNGAVIRYTTDGTAPTAESPVYSAPLQLTRTTTIRAFATEEGRDPSSVVTGEYRVIPGRTCGNIRSFLNAIISLEGPDPNTLYTITGDVTVSFQSGNLLYVEDATGALCIAGPLNRTYQPGDVISNFSGTPFVAMNDPSDRRLSPLASTFGEPKSHTEFVYTEATFDDLRNDYNIARAYILKNVYLSLDTDAETAENFGYAVFADGQKELIYNVFTGIPSHEGWYDVEGIMAKQTTESVTWMLYATMFDPASGSATEAPAISVPAGTYGDVLRVSLTAPEGAYIYYTVDGSEPTPVSTLYTEPVVISDNCTLKAIAVLPGHVGSDVAEAAYVMNLKPQTATPVLVPADGAEDFYLGQVAVTIEAAEGAAVYYTLDGSEPTDGSTLYTAPLTLTRTTTVRAIAIGEGQRASEVAEATYTIKALAPAFTPAPGKYDNAIEVTVEGAEGMTVAYTLDGSEPTVGSTVFDGPFTLAQTTTVKAIAFGEGVEPSDVTTAVYEIVIPGGIGDVTVEAIDTDALYFDLQGRRVTAPASGMLLIRVAGGEATRVLVK